LKPWVEKVNEIIEQTKILRIYFNNHYGGKGVVNAMQFKEMIGVSLSADERRVWENTIAHIRDLILEHIRKVPLYHLVMLNKLPWLS
jgi:hypothetical protein